MLVGYGASTIDLDVGQVLGEGSSGEDITLNQAQPPMSNPNTEFQQWIYNTNNGYLTNVLTGDRFGLGKAPEWFAYPNYFIVQVALEPNSNPPFPAASATTTPYGVTDVAGEQAAYNYISYHVLLGSVSSCTLEGTTYTGIRCDYNNLSATSLLDTCASDTSSWSVNAAQLQQTNPGSYPAPAPNTTPTPISNADWAAVVVQLNMECQYAASVQTTFANYNTIFTDVFESDSATIPGLASDLDVSSNTVNVVAVDYIEGSIYTVLSAAPIPGAGALANLMEMGVNTSLAKSAALTQRVNTTAGALYTTLESTFQTALTQETNGENAILEDWGRLQQIGPLAAVDGYNGLAITAPESRLSSHRPPRVTA